MELLTLSHLYFICKEMFFKERRYYSTKSSTDLATAAGSKSRQHVDETASTQGATLRKVQVWEFMQCAQ